VRGHLLDTNHVEAFCRKEPSVIQKLRTIPADWPLRVCTVTLGEIEAGHLMTQTTDQAKRDEYTECVTREFLPYAQVISIHTRLKYAKIIGKIWSLTPPPNPKKKTEQHLLELGVDVNDVWAVASAWEHNLTFVTHDQMQCIRNAVGSDVRFDCWLRPAGHTH
jgi:predicted nucleic acid-binding protein